MIEGAAGCMKRILSPYGEIYRTGGDEFVAIINIRKSEQNKLIKSLNKSFSEWKGKDLRFTFSFYRILLLRR